MDFDPMELMKNLGKVQSQMGDVQEKLKLITVSGSAGGDLVEIEMNGQFEVLNVKLDPIAVDPRDIPMLEELIQSAFVSASQKVREKIQEELAGTGMFPGGLPGMM